MWSPQFVALDMCSHGQRRHPLPVGTTGTPCRTRLNRSSPGAIVVATAISEPTGATSHTW